MKHSKHGKVAEQNKTKKIIIMLIIIIIVVSLIFYYISSKNAGMEEPTSNEQIGDENIVEEGNQNEVPEESQATEIVDISDFPSTKGGYKVIGKIVIDKLNVSNYILNETTNASLNLAVTWFWGPDSDNPALNGIGNTSIIAHNYENKNLFGEIKNLSIGDTFYIISLDGRKVTYEVKRTVSKVKPDDMQYIEEKNDGIREVTLITCDKRRTYKIYS